MKKAAVKDCFQNCREVSKAQSSTKKGLKTGLKLRVFMFSSVRSPLRGWQKKGLLQQLLSFFMILPGLSILAQQQTQFDLFPYAAYIHYNNTDSKNSAIVGGAYGYYGIGLKHAIEIDAAYTRIGFDEFVYELEGQEYHSDPFTINQADITLAYSNYLVKNLRWRIGGHAIFNDDTFNDNTVDSTFIIPGPGRHRRGHLSGSSNAFNDNAFTVFGGLQRYRAYQYNAGIDVYYSRYNDFASSLNVLQVTGTFGFYFGNYFTTGNFHAETRGHFIKLSEDIGFGAKQYASIEQTLSYFYKNLTLGGFIWAGYQVFGIQKDGFVVYNLAEKHLGAYGGNIKFGLSEKSSLKLEVAQGRFKESGSGRAANYLKLVVMAGFTL